MNDTDRSAELSEAVRRAAAARTPLRIVGGDSKRFYGRARAGEALPLAGHSGIVNYAASELVITARAGTSLAELQQVLAQERQMLAFEPPHFGAQATLGGTIACGFSGPRRPFAGSARDFVLGVRCLNGVGESLRFGGEVIKNVAGYDVSRLMVGALGTLGVLLEVSLKVMPLPARELTLTQECDAATAIARMNAYASKPLPLSGACHDGTRLYLRLSGSEAGVQSARKTLGGDLLADDAQFWLALREQRHAFFAGDSPLWRLAVAPATPMLAVRGEWFLDWGGAQRWLRSNADATTVRAQAEAAGGHATLFRGGDRAGEVFHPLAPAVHGLHRALKHAFDPHGIFNPQRLYRDW